ncbi:outer membrane efflux protein [Formosa agariphila KMM 3901]|uniref:Outer membrane efflux protein n=1 Tax=Formosa agariphila (strain DSM 15362 / KCTC 12365 / LMG 23005 / KMM 3901 / M-2Alg 35-1) TaxID=1347342 RepID=T2KMI5_FORAG|nr:TolC family protein [Formosa agariphila]CDF80112.1 outer membrane efflux protein [Formosa agariphila KMM 3901]
MSFKTYIFYSLILFSVSTSAQRILTPEEAVELTLEHNYGIKITNNTVEVAENNASILNSGYLPTLTGAAGANYNLDNTEAQFSNGETTTLNGAESSRYDASVTLNYLLFDGLGRQYNYQRLKEEFNLSQLEARETIENVVLQLFAVYYSLANISENKASLEQTINISKDRLLRSQYQFEYGQNTKLDVLNAEVDINNDSINLINTKQNLINTKRDLNVIIGNKIASDFEVETDIDFLLQLDKEDLLEKTKANNISLLQANKNIELSKIDIKSSKSQYLPSLGLNGSYGWNKNNNNAASFVSQSTNSGISGGLNLSWNLFDGGSTITQVKNSKIILENQELQKEQLILDIERNFYNAWDNYQNKLAIYRVQEDNIRTAENNFERTEEKFKLGQTTSIEFRQAQLNLRNAELSRNQAKFDAKLAELDVLQISGELLNIEL